MKCRICESGDIKDIYEGKIRNGGLGKYTGINITMHQCSTCGTIWHAPYFENLESYYESREYRESLEGSSAEQDFYRLHDMETANKFTYTGTTVFRDKIVADIGCGCGAFLDYVQGPARDIVAIEPSETYRKIMDRKGFHTYAYAEDAKEEFGNKVGVVTSFDVIEHVENPEQFLKDAYELLEDGGQAIIGTPSDCPVMRNLLGEIYEQKLLYSTQHLWIFSNESMRIMAGKIGFRDIRVKQFQRYGIGNMMGWIKDKAPGTSISADYLTETLDNVWKNELAANNMGDYIVLYAAK